VARLRQAELDETRLCETRGRVSHRTPSVLFFDIYFSGLITSATVESPGPAARTSFTDKPDPDHGRRSHITLSAKGRKLTGYAHCITRG
jgi:hypothetical protein